MRVHAAPALVRARRAFVGVLLVLALAACGGSSVPSGAAATVGGVAIPEDTLEVLVAAQSVDPETGERAGPDQYPAVGQLQRDTLGQLIQDEVVKQAARDLGIEATDEQVEERFQETAAGFGGEEGLREEIARRGRTEADVRAQLAAVIRREALQEHFQEAVEIDGADLRAAYQERLDTEFTVAKVSHILVESQDEAQRILDELQGGADFAQLAEEHSTDEFSAVNGGDLGENPRGRFVEEFDAAVWEAEAGDVVGPIQTQFGFHVIRVDAFREIPFDEVRSRLRDELAGSQAQDAFGAWFAEALAAADVSVDPRFGRWDPASGTVVLEDEIPAGPPGGPASGPQPGQGTSSPAAPAAGD